MREHANDVPAMVRTGSWPVWTEQSYALWAKYLDERIASQQ